MQTSRSLRKQKMLVVELYYSVVANGEETIVIAERATAGVLAAQVFNPPDHVAVRVLILSHTLLHPQVPVIHRVVRTSHYEMALISRSIHRQSHS